MVSGQPVTALLAASLITVIDFRVLYYIVYTTY